MRSVASLDDIRCPQGHPLAWAEWHLGDGTVANMIMTIPLYVRVLPCNYCPITITFTVASE